jgi:acyl-CoA hydrolase
MRLRIASPPEELLRHIPASADLIVPLANGEPVALLDALEDRHEQLDRVRIHQMHALHERPYLCGECGDHLRHVSYFLSAATRQAYWDGHLDLVPANFSEMPRTLREHTACTMVLAAASTPDQRGYFTLGTNADYVAPLIGKTPFFLEVTPSMPRTFGLNQIHVSQVVGYTESDHPLVEVPPAARTSATA